MTTAAETALMELATVQQRRVDAYAARVRAVALCRQAGCSWYAIAPVLDQKQPNTYRKYATIIGDVKLPKRALTEDEALAELRAAQDELIAATDAIIVSVAAARNAGAEWSAIGPVVGQAGSNAHTTFARYLRTTITVTPAPRSVRAQFPL